MIGALAFPLFPALSFNAAKRDPESRRAAPKGGPQLFSPGKGDQS
jgi:hypothetical protein